MLGVLRGSNWSPRRLGSALQLWADPSASPLTMAAGMAAQFTVANSEALTRADNAALSAPTTDLTFGGWFTFDAVTTGVAQTLIGKGTPLVGAGLATEYSMYLYTDDKVYFDLSDGVTLKEKGWGTALSAGALYFIVGVLDTAAQLLKIAVNGGTFQTVATAGVTIQDGTAIFAIGSSSTPAKYFGGNAQSCGVWKSALTQAQIVLLYNGGVPMTARQAEGAVGRGVAYWELNEPSGTRVDLWGGNDLTDVNTVTTVAGSALNAVTTAPDVSGLANHMTQATQASKPVLRMGANGIGGRAALRFPALRV